MRYITVCSGIESHSLAWHQLGWTAVSFAEIDPFCCALLEQRWPGVRNLGDFTAAEIERGSADLLMGSTPCQDFSVAGQRRGMGGARGQLTLEFLRFAERSRPAWLLWENVPGVLSSNDGRDFGAFLWRLEQLGYGWAYRTLDAQYVGGCPMHGDWRGVGPVPQRRRRVFVVAHSGDGERLGGAPFREDIQRFSRISAAVLFERESLRRDFAESGEAGSDVAGTIAPGAHPGGFNGRDAETGMLVARGLNAHGRRIDGDSETFIAATLNSGGNNGGFRTEPGEHLVTQVAHTLRADGFDGSEDGAGRGIPLVLASFNWQAGGSKAMLGISSERTTAITTNQTPAIAFQERGRADGRNLEWQEDQSYALRAVDGGGCGDWFRVAHGSAVRRLTPLECERLMNYPDDYTLITYRGKPAKDGPRYRAIGNGIAVQPLRWIGRRIMMVRRLMEAAS